MPVKIEVERYERVAVLHFIGRVSLGEGAEQFQKVSSQLLKDGHSVIVLVVDDISYTDSSGLGAIVGAYTWARNSGGEIVIAGEGPAKRLLEMTKLDNLFRMFSTVGDALAFFGVAKAKGSPD